MAGAVLEAEPWVHRWAQSTRRKAKTRTVFVSMSKSAVKVTLAQAEQFSIFDCVLKLRGQVPEPGSLLVKINSSTGCCWTTNGDRRFDPVVDFHR